MSYEFKVKFGIVNEINTGDVDIDNQTIIKGEDGKLRTAIGGYEEIEKDAVIYTNDALQLEGGDGAFQVMMNPAAFKLVGGQEYKITYNGTEYTKTSVEYSEGSFTAVYIGNPEEEPTPDFPLIIGYANDGAEEQSAVMVASDSTESTITVSLKITGDIVTVHKIPEKFLPIENQVEPDVYVVCEGINAYKDHRWFGSLWMEEIKIISSPTVLELEAAYSKGKLFISGGTNDTPEISPAKVLFADFRYGDALLIFCVGFGSSSGFSTVQKLRFNPTTKEVFEYNGTDIGMSTVGVADWNEAGGYDNYYSPVSCGDVYKFVSKRIKEDCVYLRSPTGKKFMITVDNSGTLSATEVT